LAKALSSLPEVLLLDTLPDMDRVAMLEHVRGHESTRDLPVIVLTDSGELSSMPREGELGVLGRLVKSWPTRDRLSETILGLLDRRTSPAPDRRQSSD